MNRSDAQSLALHTVVAARLRTDPTVLARARVTVQRWANSPGSPQKLWAERWRPILQQPVEAVAEFLLRQDEVGQQYRSSSPFAGAIDQAERRRILEQVWREARSA